MPIAMARCRECGTRCDPKSQARASEIYRASNEKKQDQTPQAEALSLDDMLNFAEDMTSSTSSVFNFSRSLPSNKETETPNQLDADTDASRASNEFPPHQLPTSNSSVFFQVSPHVNPEQPKEISKPSHQSSVIVSDYSSDTQTPLPSTTNQSGVRTVRKRRNRGDKALFPETIRSIKKALKTEAPEIPLPELAQSEQKQFDKEKKKWPKTIKAMKKILESNFDEQGRGAINKLCETLEELGHIPSSDSAKIIEDYLEDSRPIVRETAARSLGETRQQVAFDKLLRKLVHESVDMRAAVAVGLGELGDRRCIGPIVTLASEDPQMSIRAADALVRLGSIAVPHLIEIAESEDPSRDLIAIMALGRLEDDRALEVLGNQSAHQLATIRAQSVEALGKLGSTKALKYLVRGLKDPDLSVRINASIALKRMGDKRTSDALIAALQDSENVVLENVIAALATCGDQEAVPAILPFLNHQEEDLVIAAAEALGKLNDSAAAPKLCELLLNADAASNTPLAFKAIEAIRRLKNKECLPTLISLIHHQLPEMRERIVEAIGPIGDETIVVELEAMLKEDRNEEVRAACARALGEIGDSESVEALEESLTDTVQVRLKSVIALGKIGSSAASLSLTALLRDSLPEIRYHATQALAELGDSRSIRPIEALAIDNEPMVARGALKALQKLGDERTEKEVLKAAKKRGKKATTVKASSTSIGDYFSPAVLKETFWPDDPQRRLIMLGTAGGILAVALVAMVFFLLPSSAKVIPRGAALSASINPTGDKLFAGFSFGTVELWDLTQQKRLEQIKIDLGRIEAVSYVADDNIWLTLGNKVIRYNGDELKPLFQLNGSFSRMQMSEDRSKVAIFDKKGVAYVYSTNDATPAGSIDLSPFQHSAYSGIGDKFAAAPKAKNTPKVEIKVLSSDGEEISSITVEAPVQTMAFAPDDSALVVIHGREGKYSVVNPEDGAVIQSFQPEEKTIASSIKFTSPKDVLLFGIKNNAIKGGIAKWEIGAEEFEIFEDTPDFIPAAFLPDQLKIATVEEDVSTIFLYDIKSKTETKLDVN